MAAVGVVDEIGKWVVTDLSVDDRIMAIVGGSGICSA
jgi:hypothetical protein